MFKKRLARMCSLTLETQNFWRENFGAKISAQMRSLTLETHSSVQ
jgi:hypothetical protein